METDNWETTKKNWLHKKSKYEPEEYAMHQNSGWQYKARGTVCWKYHAVANMLTRSTEKYFNYDKPKSEKLTKDFQVMGWNHHDNHEKPSQIVIAAQIHFTTGTAWRNFQTRPSTHPIVDYLMYRLQCSQSRLLLNSFHCDLFAVKLP